MEGIRATGQHPKDKSNGGPASQGPQDRGNAKPATPQILSPKQAAEAMVESGVNRHAQRLDVLFFKAVWGGIFLSYGGMFEAVVGGVSTRVNSDWAGVIRMLEGLVFPVGLAMIVLSGTELLTSDMMFFLLAAVKGRIPWWSVPYSVRRRRKLFAGILVKYAALANTEAISSFITTAATSRVITLSWGNLLCRGIGCNIMVCMSVYLASMASDLFGKVVGVWIPLSTFVVLQYEHVVADMFTIPMAIILDAPGITPGFYIWKTMISALVGNLIGAFLLSISLYWFYLHDTTSPLVPGHHTAANADEERRGQGNNHVHTQDEAVGPLGKGFAGKPSKIQHLFRPSKHQMHDDFKNSNYERSHF
ncbi:hypothetical protein EMMF5_003985 [Cystobasidiomycetes sp. EMM_F5]